jgi:hypothetical protein
MTPFRIGLVTPAARSQTALMMKTRHSTDLVMFDPFHEMASLRTASILI